MSPALDLVTTASAATQAPRDEALVSSFDPDLVSVDHVQHVYYSGVGRDGRRVSATGATFRDAHALAVSGDDTVRIGQVQALRGDRLWVELENFTCVGVIIGVWTDDPGIVGGWENSTVGGLSFAGHESGTTMDDSPLVSSWQQDPALDRDGDDDRLGHNHAPWAGCPSQAMSRAPRWTTRRSSRAGSRTRRSIGMATTTGSVTTTRRGRPRTTSGVR